MVSAPELHYAPAREILLVPGVGGATVLPAGALQIAGWGVVTAADMVAGIQLIGERPFNAGLILIDRAAHDDLARLEEVLTTDRDMEWVALVAAQCLASTSLCRMLSTLTFDYLTLPVDPERLLFTIGHAYGKCQLLRRIRAHHHQLPDHQMIGSSAPMHALYHLLDRVATDEAPVLITGESGTGKEAAARTIHRLSARRDGPFAAVNCGALPSQLVQTELFGHEKGAFTGAHARKIGRFESAQRGIVFLDEIGDLAHEQQANLLRFLQEKRIERVGSNVEIPVDVRVVAATNADLERAVADGRFREDLFYRLNVLHLKMPPLREREGDIELLARAFLDRFARERHSRVRAFSQEALQAMERHHWPGNIRELINRIQRAVVMSDRRTLTAADLGLDRRVARGNGVTLPGARGKAEAQVIHSTLRQTHGNVSESARQLGISRSTLYRLLKKIEPG